jgi:hypothetical protein
MIIFSNFSLDILTLFHSIRAPVPQSGIERVLAEHPRPGSDILFLCHPELVPGFYW